MNRKMNLFKLCSGVLLGVWVCSMMLAGPAAAKDKIIIGASRPLSGPLAFFVHAHETFFSSLSIVSTTVAVYRASSASNFFIAFSCDSADSSSVLSVGFDPLRYCCFNNPVTLNFGMALLLLLWFVVSVTVFNSLNL